MAYTTINKSTDYFRTKLYTGNQTARSITFDESGNMQPDLVWLKPRSGTYGSGYHRLFDNVRGAGKQIYSNATNAENDNIDELSSFDTNGFSLGTQTGSNGSSTEFASWNWLANGTGSANTDGSISSTVSANTTSGFSIVSYTGTGSVATVGHNLGAVPKMFIIKRRNSTGGWITYHSGYSAGATAYLNLNDTTQYTDSGMFNNTPPTSSVFTIGTGTSTNESGGTYIAYCFADVQGYSKFGSYTGAGSNFPFIYTGFKPKWLLIRRTDTGDGWMIYDDKRIGHNPNNYLLEAHTSTAEYSSDRMDLLSNGFKPRYNWSAINASGGNYIYMAFGQSLVGSNNVPCTAR